jgi:hypothetical protein
VSREGIQFAPPDITESPITVGVILGACNITCEILRLIAIFFEVNISRIKRLSSKRFLQRNIHTFLGKVVSVRKEDHSRSKDLHPQSGVRQLQNWKVTQKAR